MSNITEKRLYSVPPTPLTSDGSISGALTVADNCILRVGQVIILKSSTQDNLSLKVKKVLPDRVTLLVGPISKGVSHKTDISAFLAGDNATIEAIEQNRPNVPEQEVERITYEEEPVVARRTILVDKYGTKIGDNNPLPVEATINVSNAGTPSIFNIQALSSSTEYSQLLPTGTVQFLLRARNKAKIAISYIANTTTVNFITVMPGNIYLVEGVKLTNSTIYMKANKDNTVIEILTWS